MGDGSGVMSSGATGELGWRARLRHSAWSCDQIAPMIRYCGLFAANRCIGRIFESGMDCYMGSKFWE
jgi:hypothetical protein